MRHRAFTLIELVAATALAALLMVALFRVTVSLAKVRTVIAQVPTVETWTKDLHRQLDRDVSQAREVMLADGMLQLLGPLGRGEASRVAHGPARIIYRVMSAEGTGLLVREELDLLDRSNKGMRTLLMCAGVGEFKIEPVSTTTPPTMAASTTHSGDGAFRYSLTLAADPREPIEGVLNRR